MPDLLRVGTHGAIRGAVISAGFHIILAQRPSGRGPDEVDTGDKQFEDPGISQIDNRCCCLLYALLPRSLFLIDAVW